MSLIFPSVHKSLKLVSSLGHDRACNHEHHSSEELHDFPQNEVENPVSYNRVHLGEDWVAWEGFTIDGGRGPCGHDAVCDAHTKEGKRNADTPEKLYNTNMSKHENGKNSSGLCICNKWSVITTRTESMHIPVACVGDHAYSITHSTLVRAILTTLLPSKRNCCDII